MGSLQQRQLCIYNNCYSKPFFSAAKSLRVSHKRADISDNFPPASGQNKLAYNVWYASAAGADVTYGTPQPSRVCGTFANIMLQNPSSNHGDTALKKISAVLFCY